MIFSTSAVPPWRGRLCAALGMIERVA